MPTTMPVSSFRELVYLLRSVLQISAACDVVALEHWAGFGAWSFSDCAWNVAHVWGAEGRLNEKLKA